MKSSSRYRQSGRQRKPYRQRNRFSHPVRNRASRVRRSSTRYNSVQERHQENLRVKRAAMVAEERWKLEQADRHILVSKNIKSRQQQSSKHLSSMGRPKRLIHNPLIAKKQDGSAEGNAYSKTFSIVVLFAVTAVLVVIVAILIFQVLLF